MWLGSPCQTQNPRRGVHMEASVHTWIVLEVPPERRLRPSASLVNEAVNDAIEVVALERVREPCALAPGRNDALRAFLGGTGFI